MPEPSADPAYGVALAASGTTAPGELSTLLAAALAPLGVSNLAVFLADFDQLVLQPLLLAQDWADVDWAGEDEEVLEHDIATTMAGRCFQTGAPVTAPRPDGIRVWVPLVERSVRIGVLAVSLPEASDSVVARCVEVGQFGGLLIASAMRYTDLVHLRRQSRTMTAAAAMQWDLLPPVTLLSPQVVSTGRLEPAYDVAGDSFDHALNGDWLHAAIFDAMGHDLSSTIMATLAVGVYRHARRGGMNLPEMYQAVDHAVAAQCAGEGFVTGLLLRLHVQTGELEWVSAGHPPPLLLRGRHVIGELEGGRCLPFGLNDVCEPAAQERLHAGDSLLLYTDGVVETRPEDGEDLSVERLGDFWARETLPDRSADEVTRRLVRLVVDRQHGKLHDDATLLLIRWTGAEA
jgi:serine phosphatase RsbU (regulator of sigma subunit)